MKADLGTFATVFTLDDHYVALGQGEQIAAIIGRAATGQKIVNLGVDEVPRCGQNSEVLQAHALDAESLAERIGRSIG